VRGASQYDGRARYHRAARYSGGFNASAVVALVSERGEGSRGPIAIDALVVTRQAVARGVDVVLVDHGLPDEYRHRKLIRTFAARP
jgi:hypothetical protein